MQSLAFSNSGHVFATGDTAKNIRAWFDNQPFFEADVRTRNDKVKPTDRIRALAFSPKGDKLYVACGDTLRAYDLLLRQEAWRRHEKRVFGLLVVSPVALAVSPAGNVLSCTDTGWVAVHDATGKPLAKWWDNEAPQHVAFLPDGMGVVGADGFSISVWEAYTGRKLQWIRSRERIFGMAASPLHDIIAARTLHYVELFDTKTMALLDRIAAPAGLPLLAFSPYDSVLALGGREEVLLLDLTSGDSYVLPTTGARVLSLAFHPSGSFLAAGGSDGVVRFWDTFTGPSVK